MKQYGTGLRGEQQAEAYLTAKGMTLLERRYRAEDGEVDLILEDEGMVIFVEVKARPRGRAGEGLLAVTPAKQRRLAHAALHFLVTREWTARPVRFDCVEITIDGILHVPNAFQPGAWG